MINGNISLEEDTELRDLVVQTLENNGVLAKVRAELRASVFLTLEEQESVLNPEPFLNKSVKQYLSNSEGKLLFSLVREFLEYFGLDYTISVYDPETYFGKEYNYSGRKKLCEELGINSEEPLLGEILKSTISSALYNSQKNDSNNLSTNKASETTEHIANTTFDISIPKILQKDLNSIANDTSQKLENPCDSNLELPYNLTINNQNELVNNEIVHGSISEVLRCSADKIKCIKNFQNLKDNCIALDNMTDQNNILLNETNTNINHHILGNTHLELHQNQETYKNKTNSMEPQTTNNVTNKKQIEQIKNIESNIEFDERIVDGMKEKIIESNNSDLLLGEIASLPSINNSVFADLPPLNGKKANINDLKELMDLAQGVSQYKDDYTSSLSISTSEEGPTNVYIKSKNSLSMQKNKQALTQIIQGENENEEIHEEISNSTSCFDNIVKNHSA
ncbi:PREDICTED: protein PF14_0175-like [Ceratosolen solmsi marchali]|uniref:Protein PF14_0175-like n=1 Tax=Ceratosolen solmsi marchali TaxID=326594 RepID=A0AAJ6YLH9_9HYME|nr:PREDICTED: protein PF14_0175-like [Ceratosolen solmsi marchali]